MHYPRAQPCARHNVVKGTDMLVRNEETGRRIDDTRNRDGVERWTVEQSYDAAVMINESHTRAMEYADTARTSLETMLGMTDAMSTFVTFLGDSARQHSIDNELCGNYERFLSGVVGGWVADNASSPVVSLAREFVRHASRARQNVVTYNVPITVSNIGRDTSYYPYSIDNAFTYGERIENATYGRATESEREAMILDYEEAQVSNENYARRGSYEVSPEQLASRRNRDNSNTVTGSRGTIVPIVNYRPDNSVSGQENEYVHVDGQRFTWCSCGEWHSDEG